MVYFLYTKVEGYSFFMKHRETAAHLKISDKSRCIKCNITHFIGLLLLLLLLCKQKITPNARYTVEYEKENKMNTKMKKYRVAR